jgi:serine phosphatase RsbU (regulator of sigma subunit)/PAS domain-containing protein
MAAPPAARPLEGLLAEAGRLLASSLELDDTLRTVARLAVPEFADWAAVDLVEPSGSLRQHSSGHADPRKDELMLAMRRRLRSQIAAGQRPVDGVTLSLQTGEPVVVQVTGFDESLLEGEEERRLIAELNPTSYLIAPLRADDRAIGALTLVSTDPGRLYDEGDLPVALELADRCAQAVDNAQRYDEAQSARALLDVVFATAPVGLSLLDDQLRIVLLNDRMATINGRPVAEQLGHTMPEIIGALADTPVALAREVLETGVARTDVEILGDDRAFLGSYAPVTVDDRVLGVICAVVETTERHRAHERASRLQGVAEQLSATLRNEEVAEVILRAGMEATGGSCAVLGLIDGDDLSIGHRIGIEGGKAPTLLPLTVGAPMPEAVRAGAPVLLGTRDAWFERFPDVPPRGDFQAFAAVPLLFEDRAVGAMGIGFPRARGFDDVDVEMLLAIARQGAQALERARLYEERAYVARTLQEGLLPRELPEIPGLDVAVLYRPIGGGGQVGGDFYDLFDVAEGCWLVAVGDVCGKGSEAAVQAGVVRNTIRALAVREWAPAEILRGVNEALLREPSATALSTAACGTVGRDGDDGAFAVTLSGGGHPPALVLRAGGTVETIETRGPMLGVQHDPPLTETAVTLAPRDLLLLYTDGVIDARRGREVFGEERLCQALASAAGGDAAAALDAVDAAVRAFHPGRPRDDKALLAIRVAP